MSKTAGPLDDLNYEEPEWKSWTTKEKVNEILQTIRNNPKKNALFAKAMESGLKQNDPWTLWMILRNPSHLKNVIDIRTKNQKAQDEYESTGGLKQTKTWPKWDVTVEADGDYLAVITLPGRTADEAKQIAFGDHPYCATEEYTNLVNNADYRDHSGSKMPETDQFESFEVLGIEPYSAKPKKIKEVTNIRSKKVQKAYKRLIEIENMIRDGSLGEDGDDASQEIQVEYYALSEFLKPWRKQLDEAYAGGGKVSSKTLKAAARPNADDYTKMEQFRAGMYFPLTVYRAIDKNPDDINMDGIGPFWTVDEECAMPHYDGVKLNNPTIVRAQVLEDDIDWEETFYQNMRYHWSEKEVYLKRGKDITLTGTKQNGDWETPTQQYAVASKTAAAKPVGPVYFYIEVPRAARGHFWDEPPEGHLEFWAFKDRPRAFHDQKIIFTFDKQPIAEAKVLKIEDPGHSICEQTGKYEKHHKIFWNPTDFKKYKTASEAPGFHFEEGGCWGMALALFDKFKSQGQSPTLVVSSDYFVHAMVQVGDELYDWSGKTNAPAGETLTSYTPDEFIAVAKTYGVAEERLWADKQWAEELINGKTAAYNDPEWGDMVPGAEDDSYRKKHGPNKVPAPQAEEPWYHGRRGKIVFDENKPMFFTRNRNEGATWYAFERGDWNEKPTIGEFRLDIKRPARYRDLLKAIKVLGLSANDISEHSGYDGENDNDYVYVPAVRDYLKTQGFDGYIAHDVIEQGSVEIAVPFAASQAKQVGNEIYDESTEQWKIGASELEMPNLLHVTQGRPDVIEDWKYLPESERAQMIKDAEIIEVDPNDLKTNQATLTKKDFERFAQTPQDINKAWGGLSGEHQPHPLILDTNQGMYVYDGNHRCAAAMANNMKVKVLYIDLRPMEGLADKQSSGGDTVIPEDIKDTYSYGSCAHLALALHDRFGWPLKVAMSKDDNPYVSHAWVEHPSGKSLDICGFDAPNDFIHPDVEVKSVTRDELESLIGGEDVEKRVDADHVIDEYILPLYLKSKTGNKTYNKNWYTPTYITKWLTKGGAQIHPAIPIDAVFFREKNQDWGKVDKFAAAMKKGEQFPMVHVIPYGGRKYKYQLVDGHHRFLAWKSLGHTTIPAYETTEYGNVWMSDKTGSDKVAAYTAYVLTGASRKTLLETFPPKFSDVIAHHVTVQLGVPKDATAPEPAKIEVVGYAADDSLEAVVVAVNGDTARADGEVYHVTLSLDRSKGRKPKDSKALVMNGWEKITPFALETLPEKLAHKMTAQKNPALDAFMQEFWSQTQPNPLNNRERVFDGSVTIECRPFDGRIHLSSIFSVNRGQGNASKTLKWFCALADKHEVAITLNPDSYGLTGGLNNEQLASWYQKEGFKFVRGQLMLREPNKLKHDKKSAWPGLLYHGTPRDIDTPTVRKEDSRMRGAFFTPDKAIAQAYAGPNGSIIAVKPKPGKKIIDATGTNEEENWHQMTLKEWQFILTEAKKAGVEMVCNYNVDFNDPFMWETFFDAWDGPAAHMPDHFLTNVLSRLGYVGVSTYDPIGLVGDVFHRFGPEAAEEAKKLDTRDVPVTVFLQDNAFDVVSKTPVNPPKEAASPKTASISGDTAILIRDGKKFVLAAVNTLDGYIEETHNYSEMTHAGWHHSFVFSSHACEMDRDGEWIVFWIDDQGEVDCTDGDLTPPIIAEIKKQIKPLLPSRSKRKPKAGISKKEAAGLKPLPLKLASFMKQAGEASYRTEVTKKPYGERIRYILATDDNPEAGWVEVNIEGTSAYMNDAFLIEELRGKGLGRRLYVHMLDDLKQRGVQTLETSRGGASPEATGVWQSLKRDYTVEDLPGGDGKQSFRLHLASRQTAAVKTYYHGSKKKFPVGMILSPQAEGYVSGDDDDMVRQTEQIMEQNRPEGALPRAKSVYMVADPKEIDFAGGYEDYIYVVEPIGKVERNDMKWYADVATYLWDDVNDTEAQRLAQGYWSGKAKGDRTPLFEYRAPQAKIVRLLPSGGESVTASMTDQTISPEEALKQIASAPQVIGGIKNLWVPIKSYPKELIDFQHSDRIKPGFRNALTVEIDPKSLATQQEHLLPNVIRYLVGHPDKINSPHQAAWEDIKYDYPIVYELASGEMFVADGNHRAAAAVLLGMKLKVLLIEVVGNISDIIRQQRENWYDDKGKKKSVEEINRGDCADFAEDVVEQVPGASIDYAEGHCFIVYQDKVYDAETPEGVPDWRNLPFYKKGSFSIEARPTDQKINLLKQQYKFDDQMIEQIIATDPSEKDYVAWIGKNVANKSIRLPEDQPKIKQQLTTFTKLKRSPKFQRNKDIGTYTPTSLYEMLEENSKEISNKDVEREEVQEGSQIIVNQGDYKIYKVEGAKALCSLSGGTNWCTAHERTAQGYLEDGPSYVMFFRNSAFAQLHPKSDQFMDRTDDPLTKGLSWTEPGENVVHWRGMVIDQTAHEFLKLLVPVAPDVAEWYKTYDPQHIPVEKLRDISDRVAWALATGNRLPVEDEANIWSKVDLTMGNRYILTFIKQRVPAWEVRLLNKQNELLVIDQQYMTAINDYVENVIHGRWPEFEELMTEKQWIGSTPLLQLVRYCKVTVKGRWEKVEAFIDQCLKPTHDFDGAREAAIEYARDVLKAPWSTVDGNAIEQDFLDTIDSNSVSYAAEVLKQRWPALEEEILRGGDHRFKADDPGAKPSWQLCSEYATKVVKATWPEFEKKIIGPIQINPWLWSVWHPQPGVVSQYIAGARKSRWPEFEYLMVDSGKITATPGVAVGTSYLAVLDAYLNALHKIGETCPSGEKESRRLHQYHEQNRVKYVE